MAFPRQARNVVGISLANSPTHYHFQISSLMAQADVVINLHPGELFKVMNAGAARVGNARRSRPRDPGQRGGVQHVAGDRAYYRMGEDKIVLPERSQFPTANAYYQTALHECGHSTGHPDRMNRESLKEGIEKGFGSPEYAREELRAEISAMMTGERVGVGHDPQRGAAYVENWVAVLEKDPLEIHRAAGDAQRDLQAW